MSSLNVIFAAHRSAANDLDALARLVAGREKQRRRWRDQFIR
jgi:hypothetical protein